MRQSIARLVATPAWERVIVGIIIANSIILGLETDAGIMAAYGPLLHGLDTIILGIFVVEIVLRIIAFGPRFFRDPWSLFDFAVVVIALIPASGPFQVLRALRILRVLRLVSAMPALRRVVGGLIAALPGMSSIIVLMAMLFYVAAVIATNLFSASFPDWFGSLGASLYTLFQVMTLESWSMGIVRPVMEAYPLAWMFFVPFILLSTYAVLNLFIGVIVSAMQEETEASASADRQALHDDTANVLTEIRALRAEVSALREKLDR
ncbi:ion transporter [Devosia chinhatensis]|uniref:Voltage-gated sodium channel n=1 Tax=Devosia chinhatensis TaxID=429727 RepID=A0A0F5FFY1_9HYPH|nr:ion transporter [Devosia chinhatensis]KKB07761.1 voltage-gated sodium channel [Devosia chinhatensis]